MVADVELTATIRTIHAAWQVTYGVPRVTGELRLEIGQPGDRKRAGSLMAPEGPQGLTRDKGWRRAKPVACARGRSFRPDRLWVADNTGTRRVRAGSTARSSSIRSRA